MRNASNPYGYEFAYKRIANVLEKVWGYFMIPKIIHYCWFGRNPKPKLAEKCIKSWKKYCKGYELIEWNENNFDISKAPLYVKQAYEARKWAFVTDYVRLWAMVNYGGIYMDTDVEVIKPLDPFLRHKAFSGFENDVQIPTGIMACEKGFPLFKELIDYYDHAFFLDENGNILDETNVIVITNICTKKGFVGNNKMQEIEGFFLYPKEYFCPIDYSTKILKKTKRTVTIHWFAGSWLTNEQRKQATINAKQRKKYRRKIKNKESLDKIIHLPNRILIALIGNEKYNKIKKKIKNKVLCLL